MDGGEKHAAGIDAHHLPCRQVRDGQNGLADQFLRLIPLVDTGKDDFTLTTSNGASINVKITDEGGGKAGIAINAAGAGDKSAVDLLKEAVGEDGLTLTYDGNDFTITKENAAAFIELVTELYKTAGVEP